MSHWQHYEHEADIGIEGVGISLEDAFIQAALGMTEIITDLEKVTPDDEIIIQCHAPDREILFVDWLNALIYEMASRKMLFSHFEVTINQQKSEIALQAMAWGEAIKPEKHQPAVEIKGATFTTLRVYEDDSHTWHAQTVVDV